MHDGDAVAIDPAPSGQMVEHLHRRAIRRQQGPRDPVPIDELEKLIALQRDRLGIMLDKGIAIEIGAAVDKTLNPRKIRYPPKP